MPNLFKLVDRLPLPKSNKLELQVTITDRVYRKQIARAREAKDAQEVRNLEGEHHEEISMLREESNVEYGKHLLHKARGLRVPIPPAFDEEGGLMVDWERGSRLGLFHLSASGVSQVRESIRAEQRWKQERQAHLVVWITAGPGFVGALTGLLAILGSWFPRLLQHWVSKLLR